MFVGGTGTALTKFRARPEEAHALMCGVLKRARAQGFLTRRLGRGVHLCDADAALLMLTLAPPADPRTEPRDTYLLSGTVTGGMPSELTRTLLSLVEDIGFTPLETSELRAGMPLLSNLTTRLDGVALVIVGHLMTDLVVQAEKALELGASAITVLCKDYPYQLRRRVSAHLRSSGVTVAPISVEAMRSHLSTVDHPTVVIDDGGYVLPSLLTEAPHLLSSVRGVVEQTMSGIYRLEPFSSLPVPVFSVAESRMKGTIESYWVADTAVRAVRDLIPDEPLEGRPALVIGFGNVGERLASVLRSLRMRVAVHDLDVLRRLSASEQGYTTSGDLSVLLRDHGPLLIFGTTGRGSLHDEHFGLLPPGAHLASVSSRDVEFDLPALAGQARRVDDLAVVGTRYHLRQGPVTVLADGFPVNFHHRESMSNRHSDLTMSALLVGASALAQPGHDFTPGHNVARSNAVLASSGLAEAFYSLGVPAPTVPSSRRPPARSRR
ncbi:hypothetical protein [Lentzea sp. NPDC051838]|uniref:hypothetical protein n=1 Tax=Lentzea sp. NPDC051838 TaxID=3154849 RepID=UPI00343DC072